MLDVCGNMTITVDIFGASRMDGGYDCGTSLDLLKIMEIHVPEKYFDKMWKLSESHMRLIMLDK